MPLSIHFYLLSCILLMGCYLDWHNGTDDSNSKFTACSWEPVPRPPSEQEKITHESALAPAKPWYQQCIRGKAVMAPRRAILPQDKAKVHLSPRLISSTC